MINVCRMEVIFMFPPSILAAVEEASVVGAVEVSDYSAIFVEAFRAGAEVQVWRFVIAAG